MSAESRVKKVQEAKGGVKKKKKKTQAQRNLSQLKWSKKVPDVLVHTEE